MTSAQWSTMMQHRGPNIDASANHAPYPRRNIDKLYCQSVTYLCAIGSRPRRSNNTSGVADEQEQDAPSTAAATATITRGPCCVPCAYKICNFDISLDSDFTKRIPNQRPEQCPRSHSSCNDGDDETDSRDGTMGYHRGMNVLTVGDGDLTFSLAVARLVVGDGNSSDRHPATRGMVVATSYENSNTLSKVYPDFDKTLASLTCHGESNVNVAYNVDATRLDETLPGHLQRGRVKFHRICWNFPCIAIDSGQDGQNDAMELNKELCRKFVANAFPYLDDDCGEIHMAHKTKPPYNQWLLEKVALEGIGNQVKIVEKYGKEFGYKGRIVFDRCILPPYTPRKALDRKSFPCHDACIYVFGWKNKNTDRDHHHSTLTTPQSPTTDDEPIPISPSSIVPVTSKMVDNIRSIHIEHSKRKHDGKTNMASKKGKGPINKRLEKS